MKTRVLVSLVLAMAIISTAAVLRPATTTITGTIRNAVTRTPIAGAKVTTDGSSYTATTDKDGHFVATTSREATLLTVAREGYLELQYPVLSVTTDSLSADIELRTDPPADASYTPRGMLPMLCIMEPAADQLAVFNSCAPERVMGYRTQIIKHNPWSLYFGPAGDRGGVLLATRR